MNQEQRWKVIAQIHEIAAGMGNQLTRIEEQLIENSLYRIRNFESLEPRELLQITNLHENLVSTPL